MSWGSERVNPTSPHTLNWGIQRVPLGVDQGHRPCPVKTTGAYTRVYTAQRERERERERERKRKRERERERERGGGERERESTIDSTATFHLLVKITSLQRPSFSCYQGSMI